MPSFDIVVNTNLQEVDNAINQAMKEITQRYDFKGTKSKIEWDKKKEITVLGDDEFKLNAVVEILQAKLIKRGLSIKNLIMGKVESGFEGTAKQKITLQTGIPTEKAKEISKLIKDQKLKVQSQIQEEQLRITGKKKDDLQECIAMVRGQDIGLDVQFTNFRD